MSRLIDIYALCYLVFHILNDIVWTTLLTFLDISWKHFLEDMHLEILALTPNLVEAR